MDTITKEVITSALKRIAKLEKEVSDLKKISTVQKVDPIIIPGLPATEEQKKYIKRLGGELENPELLTKQKAGEIIDGLLAKKKVTQSHQESPEVTEPKEIDTEEAGIDKEGLI